jgi:hypothetical protein
MLNTVVPINKHLSVDVTTIGSESWDNNENLTAGQGKMSSVSNADTSLLWLFSDNSDVQARRVGTLHNYC